MRFRIHDGNSDDSIVVEGETIEEVRENANKETGKRGWKDCWSVEIKSSLVDAARMAGVDITEVTLE